MSIPVTRHCRRATAAIGVTAAALAAAPSAGAASAVFGGSTTAHEAIVLKADAKGKKLRSIVVAWEAPCEDGRRYAFAGELTPAVAEPGFSPGARDLVTSRNGKGRFAGTQLTAGDLGAMTAAISVEVSGKLGARRASGVLAATAAIIDEATGDQVASCSTGSVRWSATRAAGRVYGGTTSQEEPIVVRLDRKGSRVNDVLAGWHSSACEPPESFLRFGEQFVNFPLRGRRFGNPFQQSYDTDDGGKIDYAYDLAGALTKKTARGRLRVHVTRTDAAGTQTMSCDSGDVSWQAATG